MGQKKDKKIWGVRIVPPETKKLKALPSPIVDLRFETWIAAGVKGGWFVTNEAVRHVIAGSLHLPLVKKKIGSVRFRLDRARKTLKDDGFFPLGYASEAKEIKGLGLASLIEARIVAHLTREFPGHAILTSKAPDWGRRKQYNKRKLKLGQAYPVKEFHQLLLESIKADVEKARLARKKAKSHLREIAKRKEKGKAKRKRLR